MSMEKLITYKISADGEGEEVDMIAITSNPAIMVKGVRLTSQAQKQAVLDFSDSDRMIIAGPAMIPDMKIYRRDEDGEYNVVFTKEVIQQLVERFAATKSGSVFNVEHTKDSAPAFVLEHWIVDDPEMDKSRTFGFTDLPKGTWFVMAKITDKEFWQEQVKNNEKFGFSIEGLLGLKLNKIDMKMKFVNALLEDGTKVYTPAFEDGKELMIIDENGDKAPIFDGDHKLEDGSVVVTVDGKITEIKPKAEMAEETIEDEVKEEVKEEVVEAEETIEEEVKEEIEEVEEELADEPTGALSADDVIALVKPMFDEVFAAIAELKGELVDDEIAEEIAELSAMDITLSKMNVIEQYFSKR